MCKNPASECQAVDHDVPAEEDPLTADESEPMSTDDDSDMSDSAGSGADSDSDAESASANRVTPTMVIWHLMKEKGLITEERYKQLQEMGVNDASLKSVAPVVLNCDSMEDSCNDNSFSFGTEGDDDEYEDDEDDENDEGKENVENETDKVNVENDEDNENDEENIDDENDEDKVNVQNVEDNENDEDNIDDENDENKENVQKDEDNENDEDNIDDENDEDDESVDDDSYVVSNTVVDKEKIDKDLKNENESSDVVSELHDKDSKGTSNNNGLELNSNQITTKVNVETAENFTKHRELTVTENKDTSEKVVLDRISETIKFAFMSEAPVKSEEGFIKQTEDVQEKNVNPDVNASGDGKEIVSQAENSLSLDKEIAKPESNTEITEKKETEINQEKQSEDDKSSEEVNFGNDDAESAKEKRTESIDNILKELVNEKRIIDEHGMVLETYAKDLDKFYDCNRALKKFNKPNETLREFALFLNFYSPSAYKYIRETFNTPLPDHRTLSKWYLKDDNRPGLSKKAFDILKRKASGKRITCALMSHAVFLTNIGLNYDQVDFGGGCNYEYTDKAVMSFVFMLVSLEENWKIPIGYFFARSVPAETHASLIQVCLTHCHKAGVDVAAVTLDTPTPAEFLGCSFDDLRNLKTTFKHPECEQEVAVWIDPCLALRSVHHTLKSKGILYHDGDKIRWNLIRKLRRLYSNDTIDYQKNHSPLYLELRNHIAKVGLTSAIFSKSLAPALSLCEELLPDMFYDSIPTQTFIENVNKLYDILNSSPTHALNFCDVLPKLDEIKAYIEEIFRNEKNNLSRLDKANLADKKLHIRSWVEGEPVSGFIAFLICIESLKHLHGSLAGKQSILATHRLCKDHVEDFVKNMRRNQNVAAENFTGWDFQCYYESLLDELDEKPRLSDRNIRLDHDTENMQSPAADIKVTSGKRAYDEDYSYQYKPAKLPKTSHETRATKMVRGYSQALDTENDQAMRRNMVGYLAGWIAAKFAKCLKCEVCIDALFSRKKLWFHKCITLKELKGICLPSEELFRVCWECERVVRSGVKHPQLQTLRNLADRIPWLKLRGHHPTHHIHLVRAIISRYIPLRVAVPLSNRETIRMSQMFGLIKCMHMTGLIQGGEL